MDLQDLKKVTEPAMLKKSRWEGITDETIIAQKDSEDGRERTAHAYLNGTAALARKFAGAFHNEVTPPEAKLPPFVHET